MTPQAPGGATCDVQEPMNWKQCMLCQSDENEELVENPKKDSYQRVLDKVEERASVLDGIYVKTQQRLQSYTKNTLCTHQEVYHRSCYAYGTNKYQIQLARDRHAHELATGCHTAKKRGQKRRSTEMDESSPSTSGSSTPFVRSRTNPLDNERCFFCQKDGDEQLHIVRTINAAILSQNVLKDQIMTN